MLGKADQRPSGFALVITLLVAATPAALVLAGPAGAAGGTVHVFPGPTNTIQDAVNTSSYGDVLLIHAGVYEWPVQVTQPGITLRGDGQGTTILDGNGEVRADGIKVTVDNVAIEDLTVQNFRGNGIFFDGVVDFRVSRVTATDNGPYGIYAIRSQLGIFEDSTATGHADSGFYLGEVLPCECVIRNVVAKDNLIGYSGTGASDITIRDSIFEDNAAGIVPNVLPNEPRPQLDLTIVHNVIRNNNNVDASERWHFSGLLHVPDGLGIVIAGGSADLIRNNTVTGHTRAGIAVVWLFTQPSLNEVVGNLVDNPGTDILWDGGGVNNCFEENRRSDGTAATFDAGVVWNTVGALPDCSTPNAGPPDPLQLARLATLVGFGCEPDAFPDGCHNEAGLPVP